ncbi:MAG: heparinase II/III family protein [Chitinophagales bacterium]
MPVGHPRVFYKPEDISRAQAHLSAHDWARRSFAELQAVADAWVGRSDESIRELVPVESPLGERSCNCPVHGGGPAEWSWLLDQPYSLRCGRGGEVYPNAEFPDEGAGWLDQRPGSATYGKRFFFVGRCRGLLFEELEEATVALAVTGILTGNLRYARKAAVIMARVAEVYRGYPQHDNADGKLPYGGKIHSNTLVESYAALRFARAYDLVEAAGALEEEDRRRIVEGLLTPMAELLKYSVEHFYCAPDFPEPMNINAWLAAGMAAVGVAIGRPDLVAYALDSPRGFFEMMDRSVLADGVWFEGAPSYNVFTVEALYQLAEVTLGYTDAAHPEPVNLYAHPRLRQMFQAPIDMLLPDGVLPPLGDSHAGESLPAWFFEVAYDRYGDPEFGDLLLASLGAPEARRGEFALFHARPLPAETGGPRRLASSVLLPEAGFAILRTSPEGGDPEQQTAVYVDYGKFRNEHSHYDLLNLLLYSKGREIVSDFGYIYWDHPLRAAWMQTTPSHNTVLVDDAQQERRGGRLLTFSPGRVAQMVEVEADQAYPVTEYYRRSLVLVEAGPDHAYLVDLFRVAGGGRHDWFLHAQSRDLSVEGLPLGPATGVPGTAPGSAFISLTGRGIKASEGMCRAVFTGETCLPGLRLHFALPAGAEVLTGLAEAQRLPVVDEGAKVPVLILRNQGRLSQFVSVLEPCRAEPFVRGVEQVEIVPCGKGPGHPFPAVGLRVRLADGTEDLILAQEPGAGSPARLVAHASGGEVVWQARLVVLRQREGRVSYMHAAGGTYLTDGRGQVLLSSAVACDREAIMS